MTAASAKRTWLVEWLAATPALNWANPSAVPQRACPRPARTRRPHLSGRSGPERCIPGDLHEPRDHLRAHEPEQDRDHEQKPPGLTRTSLGLVGPVGIAILPVVRLHARTLRGAGRKAS